MTDLSKIDVVVLCGGLGKRLRTSIGESQKTLARIEEKPFLELLLGEFARQGFRRAILCSGYKSEEVETFVKNTRLNLKMEISCESEPLGTGGAIKNAKPLVQSNPFVALNGDCFCPLDYREFVQFHQKHKAVASIALTTVQDSRDYGSIIVDQANQILSFQEKIETASVSVINTGVYCFEKDIFDLMPSENKFSIEKDFFPRLVGKKFYGYPTQVDFFDIGTPERLSQAKDYFKNGG